MSIPLASPSIMDESHGTPWVSATPAFTESDTARPAPVEIRLTDGRVALVSPEDAHLAQYTWTPSDRPNGRTYAMRNLGHGLGTIYLHREVLGLKRGDGRRGDHKDGNGLNCQRWNLRPATNSQNLCNQVRHGQAFKGITAAKGRWMARIRINRVLTYLGTFDTPEGAALAYDRAARLHFGEFAALNYPGPSERAGAARSGRMDPPSPHPRERSRTMSGSHEPGCEVKRLRAALAAKDERIAALEKVLRSFLAGVDEKWREPGHAFRLLRDARSLLDAPATPEN